MYKLILQSVNVLGWGSLATPLITPPLHITFFTLLSDPSLFHFFHFAGKMMAK